MIDNVSRDYGTFYSSNVSVPECFTRGRSASALIYSPPMHSMIRFLVIRICVHTESDVIAVLALL